MPRYAVDPAVLVTEALPETVVADSPILLEGGLLNFVWRVRTDFGSVVLKVAPPYVARRPDIPLDPRRIEFEAESLSLFLPGARLARLATEAIRPPRLLARLPGRSALVIEDLGPIGDLRDGLHTSSRAGRLGEEVGRFIGRLHVETMDDAALAGEFANRDVQSTRDRVQYRALSDWIRTGGEPDRARLASLLTKLGTRLCRPGRCLIMGDLWPPSILLAGTSVRIIDWEFAHFGRPLQDVAHLLAHTWMLRHHASSAVATRRIETFETTFLSAYNGALGRSGKRLWTEAERRNASVHFAAEILIRAVGAFREDSPYAAHSVEGPLVREACAYSLAHLREAGRLEPINRICAG